MYYLIEGDEFVLVTSALQSVPTKFNKELLNTVQLGGAKNNPSGFDMNAV